EYWIVDPVHRTVEQILLDEEADQYRLHQVYGVTQVDTAIEEVTKETTKNASEQAGKGTRKDDEDIITSPLIPWLQIPVRLIPANRCHAGSASPQNESLQSHDTPCRGRLPDPDPVPSPQEHD